MPQKWKNQQENATIQKVPQGYIKGPSLLQHTVRHQEKVLKFYFRNVVPEGTENHVYTTII